MRRRKMALRRRIRMLIVVLILVVVGILIVPISHFRVAAGEKNHSQIEYRTYVVQCGDTLWGLADSYMGENFDNHQDYIEEADAGEWNGSCLYLCRAAFDHPV